MDLLPGGLAQRTSEARAGVRAAMVPGPVEAASGNGLHPRRPGAGLYARVPTGAMAGDLDRQVAVLQAAAEEEGLHVVRIEREVASGVSRHRPRLRRLLTHGLIDVIVVETADRLASVNAELLEACLKSAGRRLLVVNPAACADGDVVAAELEDTVRLFFLQLVSPIQATAAARRARAAAFGQGWQPRSWVKP